MLELKKEADGGEGSEIRSWRCRYSMRANRRVNKRLRERVKPKTSLKTSQNHYSILSKCKKKPELEFYKKQDAVRNHLWHNWLNKMGM